MAGKIDSYISLINFKTNPAKEIGYHDSLISSNTMISLENYLSDTVSEELILKLLLSKDKKPQALECLEKHLNDNQGILMIHDKQTLFNGFVTILTDASDRVKIHCTKLLFQIIPQLGAGLDKYMNKVINQIISNIGCQTISLKKESILAIHTYMKHSLDVDPILHTIAHEGIAHQLPRKRREIILAFPTLLLPEFKDEDFFDIIHCLILNLSENFVEKELVLNVLSNVSDFVGSKTFNECVNRLSNPLQECYHQSAAENNSINSNSQNLLCNLDQTIHDPAKSDANIFSTSENRFKGFSSVRSVTQINRADMKPFVSVDSLTDIEKTSNLSKETQLSFISKDLIVDLSNTDHTVRLKALDTLKEVLLSLNEPSLVVNNVLTLMSLLQSPIVDRNYRVACAALQVVNRIVLILGPELTKYTKVFVSAVAKKIGNSKDIVRSEYYNVLLNIISVVGHQKVLNLLFEKLNSKQSKVKEDCLCFIIATLLSSKSRSNHDLNFSEICKNVTNCLTDSQSIVRRASLECIAVLGHILGSTSKEIFSAVDKVELRHDNATGIMSAVQARLLKEQLPKLKENYLVEYPIFPVSSAPVGSLQGADVQWVAAVEKSKKSSLTGIYSTHNNSNKALNSNMPKTINSNSTNFSQSRRLPSAGKQGSFPWTKNTSPPPFQPKNIWGSETELPSSSHATARKPSQRNKHITENDSSYLELHTRKKEASNNKPLTSSTLSHNSTSSKDSGYQPSFAATPYSPVSSNTSVASSALSSSCPTSFFEKNSVARPRRMKPPTIPNSESSPRSSVSPDENASPIRLKPALARSASKRRDASTSNSKELLRTESSPANVPIKLKSTSTSPRVHRLFSSPKEKTLPMVATHQFNHGAHEKSSGDPNNLLIDDPTKSPSPVGYTPSPLQRKTPTPHKPDYNRKSPLIFDREISESFFEEVTSSDLKRDPPSPRSVVSSHFSPSRHRSSEDLPENAFSSIRRSAQNKRERMKSQPCSEDSFNGSFTEFASEPNEPKASSNVTTGADESFVKPLESDSSTNLINDLPSLKYSPNTGKTFESKKVDSDVSVVGVGYPSQSFFLTSGNASEMKQTNLHSSSLSSASNNNVGVLPNRFSPLPTTTSDRSKAHRGSVQSFVGNSHSPEPTNRSFNVQGRGVFLTSPSTPPMANNENEPTTPKENKSDTDQLIDGICGFAVRQSNSGLDDLPLAQKPPSIPISLSASFKEQKERKEKKKEALIKGPHKLSRTLAYGENLRRNSNYFNSDDDSSDSEQDIMSQSLRSLPRSANYNGPSSKPGSSGPVTLTPLDHPEKSLTDTIAAMTSANSEDWEVITQGMYTIRRLATHHRSLLALHFYDVIALLNKYVPNLRSQVSKASVQAITDLYTNLKKPVVDTSLDTTIRTLLLEHGKPMSFIKAESSKSLQAIVEVATASKTLNSLLTTGLKHKNKNVRNIAARFCVELVNKMGPGKALSGVKDTTDRLLNSLISFTTDKSEEVRYYGRRIVNSLMNHEDFNQSLDHNLPPDAAQSIKNVASSIRQKGLSPPSSLGPRKSSKSGRKKVSSPSSGLANKLQTTTITPNRAKPSKGFHDQDQEKLLSLCADLSEGDITEKKSAVDLLLQKLNRDRRFVEENVVKIMSAYITLLNTAQTKLNSIGLEHLPELITNLRSHFRGVTPQLVPALLKLTTSKQHGPLALQCIELLVTHVDHLWIIQPFATSAMYSGNAKAKQIAINTVTKLIDRVARRKISVVERQVLPVLWSLVSSHNAPSGVQLRRDVVQLAQALHAVLGRRLFEFAETQNLSAKLKEVLET